jgi:hypothetical protein
MREFINLLENDQTVVLYRGDSTRIDRFEISKTDSGALLGMGIYLTSSPEVAKDYTVKDTTGGDIVFRNRNRDYDQNRDYDGSYSPKDLISAYLRKIMKDAGFDEELEKLKTLWQRQFHERMVGLEYPRGDDDRELYIQNRDKIGDQVRAEFAVVRNKLIQKYMANAKKVFAKQRPDMRIMKLTTGEYVFMKSQREGGISKFEFPTSYIARCLHAESPLPDEILPIIKAAFARAHKENDPDAKWDLRYTKKNGNNADEQIGNTIDEFIAAYKEHGARYAWTGKDGPPVMRGGKGENPSLDFLWNGTHSGYHVFQNKEGQNFIRERLEKLGYVGYAYDGGVRIAGTGARGGGGQNHNAYVLWDEEVVNECRVGEIAIKDDEVGDLEKGLRIQSLGFSGDRKQ